MHRENLDVNIGTAKISPRKPVRVCTRGTWRITYEVGKIPLKTGGKVRITIPHGFTCPQSKAFYDPGFVTVESDSEGVDFNIEIISEIFCRLDPTTGHSGAWGRNIFIELKGRDMKKGESLSLIYGNSDYYGGEDFSHAGARVRELAGPAEFIVAVDPDGFRKAPFSGYTRISKSPILHIIPGEIAKIKAIISSNLDPNNDIHAKIVESDAYNNPVTVGEQYLRHTEFDKNFATLSLDNSTTARTNPTFIDAAKNSGGKELKLLWGDIHGHTIHSDGLGELDEYYAYAQDIAALDFTAVTDHDDIGPRLSDEEWKKTNAAAERHNKPGKLVTFPGHEYRNGKCDMNVYYPKSNGELHRGVDKPYGDAKVLTEAVKIKKGMIVPHMHLGADWSGYDPEVYRVMEVYSQHGSAEYKGCPREIPYLRKQLQKSSKTNTDSYVHNALNLGYKFGLTAGSDTHSGRPGFSDWTRTCRTYLGGLTAVYAKKLNREEIWKALYNRHCYATTGNRSLLEFSINDSIMGSELSLDADSSAEIKVRCIPDGDIIKTTIFKSGEKFHEQAVDIKHGEKYELNLEDKATNKSSWYYVRLDLKGGEMVWSSPIWIN